MTVAPGIAAEEQVAAPSALTLQGTMVGDNPFGRGHDDTPYPVTLYMRGSAKRIDFTGPAGERGMFLHDAETGSSWLISLSEGIALPMESSEPDKFVVDPEQPCRHMQVRCRPAGNRYLAGKVVKGWRYRGANGRGPSGTSNGELWIDPDHGTILAWRGKRQGRDRYYGMEATAVTYDPLPEILFELPETVAVPGEEEAP